MARPSAITPAFCGLLPHPPIVVPAVGRDRIADCRSTALACADFAARVVATSPDRLFLVSPHSPRADRQFGIWSGDRLRGDLAQFGAPDAAVDLPNDVELCLALRDACRTRDVATWSIPSARLDHGAIVPLWYLVDAGWSGPTCVASLPWGSTPESCTAFGEALAGALGTLPGRPALIASGDMTHRAKPGAPSGYHPRAVGFDDALRDLVATSRLDAIPAIDRHLREIAAEDAADSSTIVAAAIGFRACGSEVLSYEHPFGVGYLVAVFYEPPGEPR